MNPGPKFISNESFSICHWNLNGIAAHNYPKILLLKAYTAVNKLDIICLPETYLDSKTLLDDDNLDISGYKLQRSDNPSNSKHGGVFIYYKEALPVRVTNVNYLNKCIIFEIKKGEKLCSFINLYRSSIQTQDDFHKFTDKLELSLNLAVQNNPYLVVVLGDFNAISKNWYG